LDGSGTAFATVLDRDRFKFFVLRRRFVSASRSSESSSTIRILFPLGIDTLLIATLAGGTAASALEKDRPMMAFREMPSGSRVDAL